LHFPIKRTIKGDNFQVTKPFQILNCWKGYLGLPLFKKGIRTNVNDSQPVLVRFHYINHEKGDTTYVSKWWKMLYDRKMSEQNDSIKTK